jgi:hypothetical protein
MDPEEFAARYAAAARHHLPPPGIDPGAPTQPHPGYALAYASLASYFQRMELANAFDTYGPLVRTVERAGTTVELLGGRLSHDSEQLRHEVRQLRFHLDQINDSLRYLADTPARRRAEARRMAWARFRRRQMPPGPPPVVRPPVGTTIRRAPEPTRHISLVDRYSGEQFEQYVAELLRRAGWPTVEVVGAGTATPGRGDHGVDIVAIDGDVRLAVQCKRYDRRHRFRPRDLREFRGGALHYRATTLAFITTADVTDAAREFAEHSYDGGQQAIVLVTREDFIAWTERRIVPEALVALRPPKATPDPEPQPQPVDPPRFPYLAVGALQVISIAALTGSQALQTIYPSYAAVAMVVGMAAFCLVPLRYGWYRWRWHWWRRGIEELWPGWRAPSWPGGRAYRGPADDWYPLDDDVADPYPLAQEEAAA